MPLLLATPCGRGQVVMRELQKAPQVPRDAVVKDREVTGLCCVGQGLRAVVAELGNGPRGSRWEGPGSLHCVSAGPSLSQGQGVGSHLRAPDLLTPGVRCA